MAAELGATNCGKIVSLQHFKEITAFVTAFKGLAIDCELALLQDERFTMYAQVTLKNIVSLQCTHNLRIYSRDRELKTKEFISKHLQQMLKDNDTHVMLNYAIAENITPVKLARSVLQSMYNKKQVSKLLKEPYLLDNDILTANIELCLCNDTLDGPMVDLRRRFLGEEYEYKVVEKD